MSDDNERGDGLPVDLLQRAMREVAWSAAIKDKTPITLSADVVDKMFSSIFLLQTALFKMTEAISKRHVGDSTYFQFNVLAIEDTKKSLQLLKEAQAGISVPGINPVANNE
ncbi:hypothetical protein [Sinorhizobium meliloti]|uniref:hypothetical protein n=1 Tax=Rhizobium meliloti TaxID=382 RepID=UPI000286132A|nr:hypothetical protein [Sinorhizobium meliloti]ASP79341.1 hypothetical protein CDO27_16035 [Sinorhizobium meliloti]MQW20847.1 hypothetical protein [Sinorhizobium meliloti]CCM66452.1 hypothetical protein BN406_00407 [Sinorhizobium meliloti Rm41]